MDIPVRWQDDYYVSKERIVFTNQQLKIPGLRTLGLHTMQSAAAPLVPHFHENCFEITFVTKGTIQFYVDHSEYKANGGDAFIAFPSEIHSTNEIPMSVGEIYWLQLDISDSSNFLFLNQTAAESLIQQLQNIPHHNIRTDNKDVRKILEKVFPLAFTPGNEVLIASYLTVYLYFLLDFSNKTQFPLTPDIGSSLTYILDNITSDITLEELADHCHLSPSHFKQKFKNEMGISPRNFINQQKIEHAKTLLLENYSITQISMILGFSTSSYFATAFKKYTSYTPSEYIQNCKTKTHLKKDDV